MDVLANLMPPLDEIPGTDTDDQKCSGKPCPQDNMGQAFHGGGVEDHGPEIIHDGPDMSQILRLDHITGRERRVSCPDNSLKVESGRCLHPGIGHDDPDGAEVCSQGHHAGGEEMHLGTHLVPAKEKQRQKSRFKEECEDSLGGQRASEDVPHKAGVSGPVGSKFKFHHDACGDSDGKDEPENLGPKMGQMVEEGIAGLDVKSFHDDQQNTQADRHRRKDVVKGYGKGKLDAREDFDRHNGADEITFAPDSAIKKEESLCNKSHCITVCVSIERILGERKK